MRWQLAKVTKNDIKILIAIKVAPKNCRKFCHLWQKSDCHARSPSFLACVGRRVSRLSKCVFCLKRLPSLCDPPTPLHSTPPHSIPLHRINRAFEYMKFIFKLLTSFALHLHSSPLKNLINYMCGWNICVFARSSLLRHCEDNPDESARTLHSSYIIILYNRARSQNAMNMEKLHLFHLILY